MRPRTRNEKLLLAVLLVILIGAGNWYAYKWLAARQATLKSTASELQNEQASAEVALQEIPTWNQRKAWVTEKQPALGDVGTAKGAVLEYVRKGAQSSKLEILEESLNDASPGPAGTRVTVSLKVKGSMQDLVTWLTGLEKPDEFYAISVFSLKADQDQKSFDCTLQIARYFKGGTT